MNSIKKIYYNSYLCYIINFIVLRLIPEIRNTFKSGAISNLWKKFQDVVLDSKIIKLFFDNEFISEIFYKSYFYRNATYRIRKISFHLPKASIRFNAFFIGLFMAVILILPDSLWSDLFWMPLFAALVLFYISRSIRERTGTVFLLINVILFLFLFLTEMALPYNTSAPLVYLLLGIDLFFLISFSLKTLDDLKSALTLLFCSGIILCGFGIIQNILFYSDASAVFDSGVTFGEILILIFPFCLLYSMEFVSGKRRIFYVSILFLLFFNAIAATHSKPALIGFLIEVSIFIIADIKYLPFLGLLVPLGLGTVIQNIKYTWQTTTASGNAINNIIKLFRQVWNFGFGVNSKKFFDIYNSAGLNSSAEISLLNIPYIKISPVYFSFIIDIGAILMIGFLFYVLRLAHSTLTSIFVAEKKYRRFFVAGLATLVGISVSSFFEINLFYSRILLVYWAVLGILRAISIINLGIYES